MAIAEAHLAATYNKPGFNLIDHYTYVLMGDGCNQEGVASEAASLAGHLKLGKLIVLYDDNLIQIDGETNLAFTEDVLKRYEAYGFHTQSVDNGDSDYNALSRAIEVAKSVTDKPSLIKVRTTIGFGSKDQGLEKTHGSPLQPDDIANVKSKFGFSPEDKFQVPQEVSDFWKSRVQEGERKNQEWDDLFAKYKQEHPELAVEFERRIQKRLPEGWEKSLPTFPADEKLTATRKYSNYVINAVADILPELIGGSADLTPSNLTQWKSAQEFQHESSGLGNYAGRYIRYGVREHGMFAVNNGIAAYGAGFIPFGATFLNFISYALGATRLTSLSLLQGIAVMTHDSIGLGEDGPTHQPIETLATLRATPNSLTFRPADGHEVAAAYYAGITNRHKFTVISLSRQEVPMIPSSSLEKALKGAYVAYESSKATPDVIITATGTEVAIAADARKILEEQGLGVRVVSFPCFQLFEEQSIEYKESVFLPGTPVVSVEALSTFGWERYSHCSLGMTTFGCSAPYKQVYAKFELVPEKVAEKAQKVIAYYKDNGLVAPNLLRRPNFDYIPHGFH